MNTTTTTTKRSIIGTIIFKGIKCYVLLDRYIVDSSPALVLVDTTTNEQLTRITANLSDTAVIPHTHVAVKNYNENEGILDVLIEAGIISKPVEWVQSGFVLFPICKLYI